jgi:hypothetical protein
MNKRYCTLSCHKRWKLFQINKMSIEGSWIFSRHIISIKENMIEYWNYCMYDWEHAVSILRRWLRSGNKCWDFLIQILPILKIAKQSPIVDQQYSQRYVEKWQILLFHFLGVRIHHFERLHDNASNTKRRVY